MGIRKVARKASGFLPLISLLLAAINDFRNPTASSSKDDEVTK